MMRSVSARLIASIFLLSLPAYSPDPPDCPIDQNALLSLTPEKFDQDLMGGWRKLAAKPGCEEAAASLIQKYIEVNADTIPIGSLHPMYWHVGQLKAFAGDSEGAIPFLMAGVNPSQRGRDIGFHHYAQGTMAFLDGDLAGLKAARDRLSALPKPDWFATQPAKGRILNWPLNLGVLEGLIRCFGHPYTVAYGDACPED